VWNLRVLALEKRNQVSALSGLLDTSKHHLGALDALLRVGQVDIQLFLSPNDACIAPPTPTYTSTQDSVIIKGVTRNNIISQTSDF
jgi:hypothetical protein